jgi:hypothetical protein
VAPLVAILERAGLGEREIAWSHLWILDNTKAVRSPVDARFLGVVA